MNNKNDLTGASLFFAMRDKHDICHSYMSVAVIMGLERFCHDVNHNVSTDVVNQVEKIFFHR